MDGKANRRNSVEAPIEKPPFELPAIFCPGKKAEMPTKRRDLQRARFYRKPAADSRTPVYGFHITTDTGERENPDSKH